LYDWGARVGQRDIFLHVDYMDNADQVCTPLHEALDKMRDAFLKKGIHVHLDCGDLYSNSVSPQDYNLDGKSHKVPFSEVVSMLSIPNTTNFYSYKYKYMDLAKKQIFHYLLMSYKFSVLEGKSVTGGYGEIKGNDLIVANNFVYNLTSDQGRNKLINIQAENIMHELGHNLGLRHGGADDVNFKPNYFSIMNYEYNQGLSTIGSNEGDRHYFMRRAYFGDATFSWYDYSLTNDQTSNTCLIDFSDGSGGQINENYVDESLGLMRPGTCGVDFNGDQAINNIITYAIDLNKDGILKLLTDYDDWGNLDFFFQRAIQGNDTGVTDVNNLKMIGDPVGDDRQETIACPFGK
jgi:hypothetical protein